LEISRTDINKHEGAAPLGPTLHGLSSRRADSIKNIKKQVRGHRPDARAPPHPKLWPEVPLLFEEWGPPPPRPSPLAAAVGERAMGGYDGARDGFQRVATD
jgi:hypothetical protein